MILQKLTYIKAQIYFFGDNAQGKTNILEAIFISSLGKSFRTNKDKELIKENEENSKIELSEKQKEAIKAINENNVTIITGGPGTGKTTIIKTIIELYEEIRIFQKNLLEKELLIDTLEKLVGYQSEKPFECVGSREEINIAICEKIQRMEKKHE